MAENGAAEEVGGRAGRVIDLADHPLLYALALTLIVVAMINILYYLAVRLGWTGVAAFFR